MLFRVQLRLYICLPDLFIDMFKQTWGWKTNQCKAFLKDFRQRVLHHAHAKQGCFIYKAKVSINTDLSGFSTTVIPQATQDLTRMNSSNNSLSLCLSLTVFLSFHASSILSSMWLMFGSKSSSLCVSFSLSFNTLLCYIFSPFFSGLSLFLKAW